MRIKVLNELILQPKEKSKVSIYWDKRIPRENTTFVDIASFQNDMCVLSPVYLHNLEKKRPQLEVENKSDSLIQFSKDMVIGLASTIKSGDPEDGPLGYQILSPFRAKNRLL